MDRTYTLRKRKRENSRAEALPLDQLLERAKKCKKIVVFTGSGLSAASGMSTFSLKGGLYERAQKKYNLSEGKKLFTYPFFERQKLDAQAFFAEIYEEAKRATPGEGHRALAAIERSGKLQRHYTLNVDGLAAAVGLSTWHPTNNPEGRTVEMHGSIQQMVCPHEGCHAVVDMDDSLMKQLLRREDIPCRSCPCPSIRCRIMLYDDKEDECITPDDVFEVLEEDMEEADMMLWVGISFEQSASTSYFRKARELLLRANRWLHCTQAIVNLSEDAHFNLLSACNNIGQIELLDVQASSDEVLPMLARVLGEGAIFTDGNEHLAPAPSPPPKLNGSQATLSVISPVWQNGHKAELQADRSSSSQQEGRNGESEGEILAVSDRDGRKDSRNLNHSVPRSPDCI